MLKISSLLNHPLSKRAGWILFAIIFYKSGLVTTIWLLEPELFKGGYDWFWLALFPILIPLFFVVNRQLGCTSGRCSKNRDAYPGSPPGA